MTRPSLADEFRMWVVEVLMLRLLLRMIPARHPDGATLVRVLMNYGRGVLTRARESHAETH